MAAANNPPGAPLLVSPAAGHRFEHGEPQAFTVSAVDQDGHPYTAGVTVRDADTDEIVVRLPGTLAPSGDLSYATAVPPLPEGRYTWSAHARDALGAAGGESDSRGFEVGRPAVFGSGSAGGDFSYDAPGIPPGSCVATAFEVDLVSHAAVIDAAFVGYAGALVMTGFGSSTCEDRILGSGSLTLSVTGTGSTQSTLSCPDLEGTFERVGASFGADVRGECWINGFPTGPTTWRFVGSAIPRDGGGETSAYSRELRLDAGLVVRSVGQQ